jgi:hypothetical protein
MNPKMLVVLNREKFMIFPGEGNALYEKRMQCGVGGASVKLFYFTNYLTN